MSSYGTTGTNLRDKRFPPMTTSNGTGALIEPCPCPVGGPVGSAGCRGQTLSRRSRAAKPATWRERFNLPPVAVLAELSKPGGAIGQRELFPTPPADNSKTARVARLCGTDNGSDGAGPAAPTFPAIPAGGSPGVVETVAEPPNRTRGE